MESKACSNHQFRLFPVNLQRFLELMRNLAATSRQRQQLSSLDDAVLKDIGLTRSKADAEASRAIWDVPSFWQR